ncbi:24637_t:CDS:1 [Dentiscutata erythropus]|uniref:24637_t:CDS:1 n=1 Tax=Dentiscutata erythropus TaxID=1348616 RepID=A0A9N9JN84_9GLOM|nr:24637_t:CDS:1 [Dentiscutata erythropus]
MQKNTNNKDATQMDYLPTTFSTTASSLQLQKSEQNTITPDNNNQIRAGDLALTTVRKTADFPTLITKTNNRPDLTQINTTTNLQTQNYLGLSIIPQTNNVIVTKANLLTIDNVAKLPDHTNKALHNQTMDTQSNAITESLLSKSYTRALVDDNQPKPK